MVRRGEQGTAAEDGEARPAARGDPFEGPRRDRPRSALDYDPRMPRRRTWIIIAASALITLAGCEDPSTAPAPSTDAATDSSAAVDVEPRSSLGAAKRSAERIEQKIGEYQQQVIDEANKSW